MLVYESGAIGARPQRLPLSIGDDDLAAGAQDLVSVPEMFNYWIGGGRIDVGFLGAAQIDRFGNINTTVIGDYDAAQGAPARRRRRPGDRPLGGARHRPAAPLAALVRGRARLHHLGRARARRRPATARPARRSSPTSASCARRRDDGELELVALHPGVELDDVREATGWPLRVREPLEVTEPVTERELSELRALRVSAEDE